MRFDSDMDARDWQNGPEPPECVECGGETTRLDDAGIPIHAACEDTRNDAAYTRSLSAFYGGSAPQTAHEHATAAHQAKRSGR
jgi:hypothetical protein